MHIVSALSLLFVTEILASEYECSAVKALYRTKECCSKPHGTFTSECASGFSKPLATVKEEAENFLSQFIYPNMYPENDASYPYISYVIGSGNDWVEGGAGQATSSRKADEHTIAQIASSTKVVTALATMIMVEQGWLKWSDTLDMFFEYWEGKTFRRLKHVDILVTDIEAGKVTYTPDNPANALGSGTAEIEGSSFKYDVLIEANYATSIGAVERDIHGNVIKLPIVYGDTFSPPNVLQCLQESSGWSVYGLPLNGGFHRDPANGGAKFNSLLAWGELFQTELSEYTSSINKTNVAQDLELSEIWYYVSTRSDTYTLPEAMNAYGIVPFVPDDVGTFSYGVGDIFMGNVLITAYERQFPGELDGVKAPINYIYKKLILDPLGMSDTFIYLPQEELNSKVSRIGDFWENGAFKTLGNYAQFSQFFGKQFEWELRENSDNYTMNTYVTYNSYDNTNARTFPAIEQCVNDKCREDAGAGLYSTSHDFGKLLHTLANGGVSREGKRLVAKSTIDFVLHTSGNNEVGASRDWLSNLYGTDFRMTSQVPGGSASVYPKGNEIYANNFISFGTWSWGGYFNSRWVVNLVDKTYVYVQPFVHGASSNTNNMNAARDGFMKYVKRVLS